MSRQQQYLRDILECIQRIVQFTATGRDAFLQSPLLQDAVIRNFEVIGEIVKRLSPDLLHPYAQIPWRSIAGFRDVLIHDYENVDLESVWDTVQKDLPPLKSVVETMLATLEENED